jgi:hypothetical protein
MNAKLLNRSVLAKPLFCICDKGPAVVTRGLVKGKALDTLRFHVATKIERTVKVSLHLPAAVLGASYVDEKMQGSKAHK